MNELNYKSMQRLYFRMVKKRAVNKAALFLCFLSDVKFQLFAKICCITYVICFTPLVNLFGGEEVVTEALSIGLLVAIVGIFVDFDIDKEA